MCKYADMQIQSRIIPLGEFLSAQRVVLPAHAFGRYHRHAADRLYTDCLIFLQRFYDRYHVAFR